MHTWCAEMKRRTRAKIEVGTRTRFHMKKVETTNLRSLRILREWREGVRLRWSPLGLLSVRIFSEIGPSFKKNLFNTKLPKKWSDDDDSVQAKNSALESGTTIQKEHALAPRLKWQSEALRMSQTWLTMVASFLVSRDINSFHLKWPRRRLDKQSLNLATVSSPLSPSSSREMAGRPGRTNGDKTYVEIVNCDHGDLAIGPIVLTHSCRPSLAWAQSQCFQLEGSAFTHCSKNDALFKILFLTIHAHKKNVTKVYSIHITQ